MKALAFVVKAAVAAITLTGTAHAADVITYNSTPNENWHMGNGNDYSPSNTAVLTTDAGDELALRMHQTFASAPASNGNGLYQFAVGTDPMSFDWGIQTTSTITALLTLTNIGSGQQFSYDPFFFINDNEVQNNSTQNSFRLNWAGIGYDSNADGLYQVNLNVSGLSGGTRSFDVYAQIGQGVGAVPEPATWAFMIFGFGAIGGAMRRQRKANVKVSFA